MVAKTSNKIRAAIYKRVSTCGQADDGYSLDSQERILIQYCNVKEYEIVKVYADEGISAKDIKKKT